MWWSCHSREQGIVRRRAGKITERKLSWNQRGLALILDICSIRGGITKLGRSANVLVGLAVVGVFLQPKPDERREDRQSQTTAIIVSDRCNCPRFDIFGKPLGFLFAGGGWRRIWVFGVRAGGDARIWKLRRDLRRGLRLLGGRDFACGRGWR
jgi:hypothetical protein